MNKDSKKFIGIASMLGMIAVGLGAFGAHALKSFLFENGRIDTFETAVLYHFIHVLGLFGIGLLTNQVSNKWINRAGWAFVGGIIIFSGSLYLLCFTGITILGAITPIGGILFIAGWLFLFVATIKK